MRQRGEGREREEGDGTGYTAANTQRKESENREVRSSVCLKQQQLSDHSLQVKESVSFKLLSVFDGSDLHSARLRMDCERSASSPLAPS